jgi:hypothetical protein
MLSYRRYILRGVSIAVITALLLGLAWVTAPAAMNGLFLPLVERNWPVNTPMISPIVISELLYNPEGEEPEQEWIEIYHRGTSEVDLGEYKIGDEESQGSGEGMFKFPEERISLAGKLSWLPIARYCSDRNMGTNRILSWLIPIPM